MAALRQPGLNIVVLTLLAIVVGSGPVCAAICSPTAAGSTGAERATAARTGCHDVPSSGEAVGSESAPCCSHGAFFGPDAAGTLKAPNTGSRALVLLTGYGAAGAWVRALPRAATTGLPTSLLLVPPARAPLVLRI